MTIANIVNVATINGFLVNGAVTTSDTDIVTVAADYVYKINTVMITNIDGTNTAGVSLKISTDGASTYHLIADNIPIPPKTVLTIIDKNNSIYMDETDRMRISGSANSDLTYHVSGEKITD
jgi:hypothetical protein